MPLGLIDLGDSRRERKRFRSLTTEEALAFKMVGIPVIDLREYSD